MSEAEGVRATAQGAPWSEHWIRSILTHISDTVSIADAAGVITPFPGGVVRSGSKVGSKYKQLVASTNDAFCPNLRGRVDTELVADANCAYEIVINGVDEPTVAAAMRTAIEAAAGAGVPAISAGNYGGKLGKFHIALRRLFA